MTRIKKLVLSAFFLACAYLLPFLTGQIPKIGSMLCPMHIPVLLCGFICGWPWGLAVGILAPLSRHLLLGMPPLLTALCMTFELGAYGALAGIFYRILPQRPMHAYPSLILAMLGGRIVWGLAAAVIYPLFSSAFSWHLFAAGAFVNAIPGIILQLAVIPAILYALKRAKLIE